MAITFASATQFIAEKFSTAAADPMETLTTIFSFPAVTIHLASITVVLAYLFRDQVRLRFMVIIGQMLFMIFYMSQATGPLWEPVFWNGLIAATNVLMIFVILRERSPGRLTADERKLMNHFQGLTPGELRRALRLAEWVTAEDTTTIIERGQSPDCVYFLLEGRAEVNRHDRSFDVTQGVFLGEISHLLQRPATATVTVQPGTRYLRWRGEALTALMDKNISVDRAFRSLFNRDLATKVAAG